MDVRLMPEPFDPWKEIQEYLATSAEERKNCGAIAVFVGAMRKRSGGAELRGMELEHYPEMTRAHLERLAAEARRRHGLADVLLRHRVGRVRPAETIVLVAVWAAHRREAYAGNRFLMEDLKSSAPLWKREEFADGGRRWVEGETPD